MFFDDWYDIARVAIVGSASYVSLIVILRLSGKRTLAKMNAFDFVVTVALGSTLATMLLSSEVALFEGLAALALLIGLQYVVAWSSAHIQGVERVVKDEPRLLYYEGKAFEGALRRERVSRAELEAAVREQGYASLDDVRAVVLETAGDFSVIPVESRGAALLRGVRGFPEAGGGG